MPNSESFTATSEPTLNGNPVQEQQNVRVFPVQFDSETIGLLRAGYDVPLKFVPADSLSSSSYWVIDDRRSAQLLPNPSLHLNEHNAKIPQLIFENQEAFDYHQLWHLTSPPQMEQRGGGNDLNWTVEQKGLIQETEQVASFQHHFDYDPSTASLLSQIAAQARGANLEPGEPLLVTVQESQVRAATSAPAMASPSKSESLSALEPPSVPSEISPSSVQEPKPISVEERRVAYPAQSGTFPTD